MNIHEYQAKAFFGSMGIPVPKGAMARTVNEVREMASALAPGKLVVKAQILAGGRGKAGGVKVVESVSAAMQAAEGLLGQMLVTPQTGPQGKKVNAVLVEEGCTVEHEFYAGLTLDRAAKRTVFMVSSQGGMSIEEVAQSHPESIVKVRIDPLYGLRGFEARFLAGGLGLSGKLMLEASKLFIKMSRLYEGTDASLLEINPLVLTSEGQFLALDGKMSFDEAALPRQPGLAEKKDTTDESPMELEAEALDIKYIALPGTVGTFANGAGLAMSTMDIIQEVGKKPANFLDIGGGASADKVAAGLNLVFHTAGVKAVFINIFGGILRGDILAEGLLQVLEGKPSPVPLIIRLVGTNAEAGQKLLHASGLPFTLVDTLQEAKMALCALAVH